MPSRWIEFVKEWSKNNNVSYGCALSDARMKAQYYKKYPKKLTKAQLIQKEEAEKATMLMEDVNVAKKEKKEKYKNRLNAVEASLDLKDFIQANKLLKELKTKDITNPDTRKKLKQLIIRFNNERPKKPSVPIEEEKILAQPVLKRRKTKELVEEEPLPTYQNIKDTRTPQQKVFDISDLDREIQSYLKDELSDIDEKLLKRLILEWLDRFIKVRGKINEKTKDWLNQSPIKIIDDFRVMYDRHKKGINNLPNLPVFKFTGDEFTPKKLKEYILLKIAEDPFSNWKVGDEGLINRNPVKVIKKDALELKVRFDEPSGRRYINDGYFEKFDSRTYKGSLMTLKKNNIEYLTKIPSNYDWEKFVDTRYG